MLRNPKVSDLVRSESTSKVGKVIEVNLKWSWFIVQFAHKETRFDLVNNRCLSLTKLTPVEKADYLLYLENHGISDQWAT